ncbi:MAG: DUF2236 domain-containing protein [Alcanivorax sp.]|nr:DUF2236 domain-containing protein [Alcanivorax sp.]
MTTAHATDTPFAATPASAVAAPRRARPFDKTQAPTSALIRLIAGRELAPTRQEYDAAVAALQDGDPAMDTLVEWMYDYGPREARALFEQALAQGVEQVADCPEPLRRFFREVEAEPVWLDRTLLAEGARFIQGSGLTAAYVLRDLALMGGYLLSGFNQSLVLTGALNKGTARRVAETGKWWIDCTEEGGLAPGADGVRATLHVRLVHALVRRNLAGRPEWDSSEWGMPLCQIDMAATYLGFSVVMLGGLRKLGIPVTRRESRAVMHLWRYTCWLMGVQEKWLVDSEREGMVLLHHTIMTQSRPDWTSRELGQALAQEPLERSYSRWQSLRRKLDYHRHLSVSQYFLGSEKMAQLGLQGASSWYPLLTMPLRVLGYSLQRFVPGLRRLQQRRGRRAQQAALAAMFGDQTQGVIQPGKDHPAHL